MKASRRGSYCLRSNRGSLEDLGEQPSSQAIEHFGLRKLLSGLIKQ